MQKSETINSLKAKIENLNNQNSSLKKEVLDLISEKKIGLLSHKKTEMKISDLKQSLFLINQKADVIYDLCDILNDDTVGFEERRTYVSKIFDQLDSVKSIIQQSLKIEDKDIEQVEIKKEIVILRELITLIEKESRTLIDKSGKNIHLGFKIQNENLSFIADNKLIKLTIEQLLESTISKTNLGSISVNIGLERPTAGVADKIAFMINCTNLEEEIGAEDLSKTKVLIDKMEGEFSYNTIDSNLSKLIIKIPYIPVSQDKESAGIAIKSKILDSSKILVAEDVAANYELIEAILNKAGASVEWARNGQEAITKYNSIGDFDIVLMDIQMPVMNGYEALEGIRKMKPNSIVIAVTAFAMLNDREKILEAGFNDYIAKPIDPNDFIDKISSYIN